jgi:hypothetical protein
MSAKIDPEAAHLLCVACKSTINTGATLCPVCKAHQTPWKNWLTYLGGTVALLTLITSGVTYTFTTLSKALSKDDLVVVQYNSNGRSILATNGQSDLFVSHVELEDVVIEGHGMASIIYINKVVRPHELTLVDDSPSQELRQVAVPFEQCLSSNSTTEFVYDIDNPEFVVQQKRWGRDFQPVYQAARIFFYSARTGKRSSTRFSVARTCFARVNDTTDRAH